MATVTDYMSREQKPMSEFASYTLQLRTLVAKTGLESLATVRTCLSALAATVVSGVLVFSSTQAEAACPFVPTNDVPLDMEGGLPLAYPGKLNLFNIYWAGDWDANPANFRRADIEKAMNTVLGTPYFDRMCQYGVPGFQFEGGVQAAGICGSEPGPV